MQVMHGTAVFVLLPFLLASCGTKGPSGPARGFDVGESFDMGFGTDDGIGSDEVADRPIRWCGALEFVFDSSDESCPNCATFDCECIQFPGCGGRDGCLSSANCDVVCEDPGRAFECFYLDRGPCAENGDCDSGFCVTDGTYSECSTGSSGDVCVEPSDCASGRCVANRCTEGANGAECAVDEHCLGSATCLRTEPLSSPGVCADGGQSSPCLKDADCTVGACTLLNTGNSYGWCSDGTQDSACASDADCRDDHYCNEVSYTCADGSADDFCTTDAQCQSGRCALTAMPSRCTNGEVGDLCDDVSDCNTMFCAAGPTPDGMLGSVCSTGEVGSPCSTDAACLEGSSCATHFGSGPDGWCTTGQPGEPCGLDLHCLSDEASRCVGAYPGFCGAGQVGDRCFENQDCISGSCEGMCL